MSEPIKMPALGESIDEGTVTTWLKNVGDTVEADEPIVEVSTDKVDTEVPAPAAGVLESIEVGEDETVSVGTVLGYIGDGSGAAAPAETPAKEPAAEPEAPAPAPEEPAAPAASDSGVEVKMPALGESVDEGTVTTWLKQVGDEVEEDEPIVEVSTDKVDTEVPAPASGILTQIKVSEDETVSVGTVLAVIGGEAPAAPAGGIKTQIAQKAKEAATLRGTRQKMTGVRKAIAKHMIDSLATSAQLTTVMEVDVTRIVKLRAQAKATFQAREGVNLTYLPVFVQAATEALKAHPIINSSVEDNEIVYHDVEHVGIAVDTERGLFVPVIKKAGDLNIAGIAKQIADLAARTRDGKIKADELAGSTFTITNTGSAGAAFDTPIINQPNVAIMGTGAIFKAPGVVKDQDGNEVIAIRSKCFLSISYDHRIIDGAAASRFLRDVKFRLEEGDFPEVL